MHKLLLKAIFLNWLSIFELTELFRNGFRSPAVKVLRSGFCVSFVIVNDITCIPYTALGVSGFIHCSRGIPETWTQGLAGRKPFLEKYILILYFNVYFNNAHNSSFKTSPSPLFSHKFVFTKFLWLHITVSWMLAPHHSHD